MRGLFPVMGCRACAAGWRVAFSHWINYHSVAFEWVAHFRDSGGKKILVNRDLNMAGFLIKKFLPYYQK